MPEGTAPTILALDDPRWVRFVAQRPEALAFHLPEWGCALTETYGYADPFAVTVTDSGGAVVAGLPVVEVRAPLARRRWISLPFTDYVPPLGDDSDALAQALDAARHEAGVQKVEVRAPFAGHRAQQHADAVLHTLELTRDADTVFGGFKRSQVQQPIRKQLERKELEIRCGESKDDLVRTFYALHLETRRRRGAPVQPRRFFELLWDRLLSAGLGFVLVAYRGGTPAAAAVFLAWNRTLIYKYSASLPEYLKLRPNNLLLWHAMRWGCENGFHTFDFGRSDADNHGLRKFKSGWGALERPLAYTTVADRPVARGSGRLLHLAGPVIRRSPPWVCRAAGELLYKYAA